MEQFELAGERALFYCRSYEEAYLTGLGVSKFFVYTYYIHNVLRDSCFYYYLMTI
jgi:hypothetical protein